MKVVEKELKSPKHIWSIEIKRRDQSEKHIGNDSPFVLSAEFLDGTTEEIVLDDNVTRRLGRGILSKNRYSMYTALMSVVSSILEDEDALA